METLARSSWKVIFNNYRDRCFLSSRDVLSRPQIRSVRFPEHLRIGLSYSISLQHKRIYSIFASSVSSSEPQTHLQNEETQIPDQSKTVPVKFQLQKKCSFGEQFYIIGDDPIFGSWDPSSAIPLEWSDGHVWSVELDIPIEKSIQFKFMLKGISGSILWQPDPDRILQTWETKNKITVSEDWDDAELQKVIEEELTFNQNEESTVNSEMLNEESTVNSEMLNKEYTVNSDMLNEESTTSGITNPMENTLAEKPMAIVAENITEPIENRQVNQENILGNNGRPVTVEDIGSIKDEGNYLVSYDGGPVLVPGLIPLPIGDTGEASPTEVEKNITSDSSFRSDKAKEHNVPELDLKEELDNDSPRLQETTEMMMHGDYEELNGNEQVEKTLLAEEQDQPESEQILNDVLENDVQWGRKTLQKFLITLGFL